MPVTLRNDHVVMRARNLTNCEKKPDKILDINGISI